jgi:AcrR family transcriptional regulator
VPRHDSFLDRPANTREAILRATHEVLCEHGDDGTSMSRIADRAGVSKSVLYHHYDDRDDLLRELLEATLTVFVAESIDEDGRDDPLLRFVEAALSEPFPGDVEGSDSAVTTAFARTYVELRARAARDPQYCEHFTRLEGRLRERFVEGSRPATPARGGTAADTGEHLLTLAQGLFFQRVTADGVELDALRPAFERAVGSCPENDTTGDE